MIYFRRLFIVTILMLIVCSTLFITGCQHNNLTNVRLNEVVHSVFYTPQYVALSKGFFENEGLNIELTTGQGADKTMTALLAGQCDIGFAGPEACIYVYNQGREDFAVVFGQLTQKDGSFLLSKEPDSNFKWKNTFGKTIIGGRPGGVPEMTLEYVLNKNNINPQNDVTLITNIQFTATAGAFASGTGDYVALFEPTASIVEKEGTGSIVASIGADSGIVPYTTYFTTKSYIEQNPDIVQQFTNAIYKGQMWVCNNKAEEVAKVIQPFFKDTDYDILVSSIQRYKDIDAWSKNPIITPNSLDLLQNIVKDAGQLDKKVDFDIIVNTKFAEEAVKNNK